MIFVLFVVAMPAWLMKMKLKLGAVLSDGKPLADNSEASCKEAMGHPRCCQKCKGEELSGRHTLDCTVFSFQSPLMMSVTSGSGYLTNDFLV